LKVGIGLLQPEGIIMNEENSINIGLSSSAKYIVEESHSAKHIGSGTVRVLSTPSLIAFLEITARKMMDDHLPITHTTVGTHVDIHHMAAAQIGAEVEARVVLAARDRKQITLKVDLYNGKTQVATGSHKRFIINKQNFKKNLQNQKAE
jgi:fluoroacetyl-CoA thioesterase